MQRDVVRGRELVHSCQRMCEAPAPMVGGLEQALEQQLNNHAAAHTLSASARCGRPGGLIRGRGHAVHEHGPEAGRAGAEAGHRAARAGHAAGAGRQRVRAQHAGTATPAPVTRTASCGLRVRWNLPVVPLSWLCRCWARGSFARGAALKCRLPRQPDPSVWPACVAGHTADSAAQSAHAAWRAGLAAARRRASPRSTRPRGRRSSSCARRRWSRRGPGMTSTPRSPSRSCPGILGASGPRLGACLCSFLVRSGTGSRITMYRNAVRISSQGASCHALVSVPALQPVLD